MSEYKDPVIERIIQHFEENGPSELKGKWHHGDLLSVNPNDLPIAYVTKDETMMEPANTMEDEHRHMVVATVIHDATEDLDAAYGMVAGMSGLFDFMEGRNADYTLKEDSLLYLARPSQQLEPKFFIGVGTPAQIRYGLGIGRRGPGIFSVEATLRFTVRLHLAHPGL